MAVVDPGGLLEPTDLAAFGPVIPVIVIDQAERRGADGARPGRRRRPGARGDAAHRRRRWRAIEAIAREVPEAIVGAGTLRSAADARSAQAAGARFGVSPGYSAAVAEACRALGLPLLPGVATASEVMQAADDGFRFLKFFPAVGRGRPGPAQGLGQPVRRHRLLSHRRHRHRQRAGLAGAAERQGRRRLVADAGRGAGGRGLGADHQAGARGERAAQGLSAGAARRALRRRARSAADVHCL